MDFLKLSEKKLDVTEICELVAHESCGAVAMFAGTTRDNFQGKSVISLEYEAYEGMAKKEMSSICYEVRQRWPDVKNIAIYHRLGLVPVKEASVVIAISSPHRQSGLEAVPFTLDELKKSVPVWKKENYKDPESTLKIKRTKLNIHDCKVMDFGKIPSSMIQINADEKEVCRRIISFIEKKREEIDRTNVNDFIEAGCSVDSCARVNSAIFRTQDNKGHLRIRRVKNEYGPQDVDYKNALDKLMDHPGETKNNTFNSIDERLENAEQFLQIKSSISPSIFARLKAIEDTIMYLETVSPEYSHFLSKQLNRTVRKVTYTLDDIDKIIQGIETKS
ncbi:unnamed protein product [Diamesa serratosioi]